MPELLTLSYRPISLSVAVICHSILCTLAPMASLCDNWSRVLGLMYAAFLLEPSLQVCVRVSKRVDSFAFNDRYRDGFKLALWCSFIQLSISNLCFHENIFLYIQKITKWKCARLTKTCLFFQCKVVFICLQSGMSSIISFYLTSWTEIHLWAKFLEKCPFIPGDITRSELRNNKMNWNYWLGLQC